MALGHADDVVLRGTRLDILVDLRNRNGNEEGVGPAAVLDAGLQLAEQGEIIVVETRQVLDDESRPLFVPDLYATHQIIVLRIAGADDGLEDQAGLLSGVLCVEIGLVRMERSHAVREIEVVAAAAVRDDVHGTTQRVASEAGGNDTFIDFDPVDDVDGQVGQRHAGALGVERHPVEEIADRVPAHAVDGQVEVAAHAALFADADAGGLVDGLGKRLQRAGLQADVERAHGECTFAQFLLAAPGRDGRILQRERIDERPLYRQGILPVNREAQPQEGQRHDQSVPDIHRSVKLLLPESFIAQPIRQVFWLVPRPASSRPEGQ